MARTHQADTAASTSDLELVKGIGPRVAAVLHDAGINSLTELVARTPEELATKLVEHHVRVPAEKIVTDDWLGQARSLLHDSVAADTATSASAETATAIDHPWHELAGFSVFVERDALGRTQTRLTDYETSEEYTVAGHAPDLWVPWIMERLPEPLTEDVATFTAGRGRELRCPDPGRTRSARRHRSLGPLPARRSALGRTDDEQYRVEVHLVDADTGNTAMFKEHRGRLETDRADYVASLSFPAPDSGRYEMFSSVQLGTGRPSYRRGPRFGCNRPGGTTAMATDNSQQARAWMHRRFGAVLAGKATDAFCVRAAATERAAADGRSGSLSRRRSRARGGGSPMP